MSDAAAIPATTKGVRTYTDDSVEIKLLVEPAHAEAALRLFRQHGTAVALARLTDDAARDAMRQPAPIPPGPYAAHVARLHRAYVFRAPALRDALGITADADDATVKAALAAKLGKPRLSHVPPHELRDWLARWEVAVILPRDYLEDFSHAD